MKEPYKEGVSHKPELLDFNKWLKTDMGVQCCDYSSLLRSGEKYLEHRLFWAFTTGQKNNHDAHRLQQTLEWYEGTK